MATASAMNRSVSTLVSVTGTSRSSAGTVGETASPSTRKTTVINSTAPRPIAIATGQLVRLLVLTNLEVCQRAGGSDRLGTLLAGAQPDDLVDGEDPELAVADLAGHRPVPDRLDHVVHQCVVDHHLDAQLGQQVDAVLGAAVDLGVPALATGARHLR